MPSTTEDIDPLTRLAIKHGTDKWGLHFYTGIFHRLFSHLRENRVRLLEIGVGGFNFKSIGGASLAMWAEYFPNGQIVGIDIAEKKLDLGPRVSIHRGSQEDTAFLERISDAHGPFDIVLDDGSHIPKHVAASFYALFPRMAPDGIYVIEDVQTCFWPQFGGSAVDGGETMKLALSVLAYLNHAELRVADSKLQIPAIARQIRSLRAFHNLLIIEKGDNDEPSTGNYELSNPDAARAVRLMEQELERSPTPNGIANLISVCCLGKDYPKAMTLARDALAKWPDNPALLLAAFNAAAGCNELQSKLDYVERLHRLEPDIALSALEQTRAETLSTRMVP